MYARLCLAPGKPAQAVLKAIDRLVGLLCLGLSIRKPQAHVPPKNRDRTYDNATDAPLRHGHRTTRPRHFPRLPRATCPPIRCANRVYLPYPFPRQHKLTPLREVGLVPLAVLVKSLGDWVRAVSIYPLRCTNLFAHRIDDANLNYCICFHMFIMF